MSYPYMIVSRSMPVLAIGSVLLLRDYRRPLLLSSLLMTFYAVFSFEFIPQY